MLARRRHRRNSARQVVRSAGAVAVAVEILEIRRLLSDYVVNTTADETITNSTTSLREAVILAEASGGDDRITFDPIVFPPSMGVPLTTTIVLTQGPIYFLAPTIGKVTIDGVGASVTLSGGDANRIFLTDTDSDVALARLVLREGFASDSGGAIVNTGQLALDNVQFRDNHVVGSNGSEGVGGGSAFGGAITNSGTGTIAITDSFFDENTVLGGIGGPGDAGAAGAGGNAAGGAIFNLGAITMTDSFVGNNRATGGPGGSGAVGVGGDGGDATGGGILVSDDGTLNITDSTINANAAFGGAGNSTGPGQNAGRGGDGIGGGLASRGAVTAVRLDMSGNAARGGDGGSTISGGAPGVGGDADGGAIFNGGEMSLAGGQIGTHGAGGGDSEGTGGVARGGAISNAGPLAIDGVNVVGGDAVGGSGGKIGGEGLGGGIYHAGAAATLDIANSFVRSNHVRGGTGATQGSGRGWGGGIHALAAFDIDTTAIIDNQASGGGAAANSGLGGAQGAGGGIFMLGGFVATITDTTLSGNDARGGAGANAVAGAAGNGGPGSGGAFYLGAHLVIENSTVYGNVAEGGAGGTGDAGPTTGGAGGPAGGGAFAMDNTTLDTLNVTIAHNAATGGAGGTGGIANGDDGESAGGAFMLSDVVTLTNTIVADNTADTIPNFNGAVKLVNSLVSTPPGDYSLAAGSTGYQLDTPAGLGPLADNGGPTQTARLLPGSAAIDAGDDAAAEAVFGADGNDQRGDGFPRFRGSHVDIGAYENAGPAIKVTGNGVTIANGDTTPSSGDFTNFGSAEQGAAALQRTFVIANTGEDDLEIIDVALPGGYAIVGAAPDVIEPGDSDTLTIRLGTATAGTFAGNVVLDTTDLEPPADANFKFRITGTITPNTPVGTPPVKINFQPSGRPVPSGYLADVGSVFGSRGNGFSYGWNQAIGTATRDRNINSDQKLDTLVHTQLYGNRTWEIGVPNGTYTVKLVAGDPQYFDSVYKINVEGVLTVNGTPTSGNRFITGTKTVTVSDGKLTVSNASGAVNNKLNYIEITPASATTKINFQPSGRPVPSGFLADTGNTFANRGNGFSYGWNSSASSFTRDRNKNSDQKLDTLVHMQLYGVRTWELGVANGTYSVKLVAGDPQYFDSVYKINVEGQLTVNGTPTSGNRFITGTKTVTVSDGRLTVTNAAGSVNNKLAYIEVTPV